MLNHDQDSKTDPFNASNLIEWYKYMQPQERMPKKASNPASKQRKTPRLNPYLGMQPIKDKLGWKYPHILPNGGIEYYDYRHPDFGMIKMD